MVLTNNFKNILDQTIQNLFNAGNTTLNTGTYPFESDSSLTDLVWKSEDDDVPVSTKKIESTHAYFSFYIDADQMNDLPYNIRSGETPSDLNFDQTKGVKIKINPLDVSFTIKKLVLPIKQISADSTTVNFSIINENNEVVATQSIDISSTSYTNVEVTFNESTIPSMQYYILIKPVNGTFSVQTISEDLGDLYEDNTPIGAAIVSKIYIDRICELGMYNDQTGTKSIWARELANPPLRKDSNTALQIDWEYYWDIEG